MHWLIEICCCVLMFSDVAEVSSDGAPPAHKLVYTGQAAELFNLENDTVNPYLYNEFEDLIASWNGTTIYVTYMMPDYIGRITMDKTRRIWMLGVETNDSGKYSVSSEQVSERHEFVLNVKDILTVEQLQACPYFTQEGHLTVEKIRQEIRELLDERTEHINEYLGYYYTRIIGLLIALLVIVVLAIIGFIIANIYKKCCSKSKQTSKSHDYETVPNNGSAPAQMEMAQSNISDIARLPDSVMIRYEEP